MNTSQQPASTNSSSGARSPLRGPWLRRHGANLALTLPFVILFFVQLIHHQMWRDELNAFGIAVASPSLGRLFHYIHYEGHPWLWYVLLWLVSRLTVLPAGMRILQAFIGLGILLLLGVVSPFSRWQKVLLFLSYFVVFEYTVISRMYGLMLLLALLYLWRRSSKPAGVYGNALLLGLLASTDVIGLILSVALAAEFAFSPEGRELLSKEHGASQRKKVALAAGLYAALLILSAASLFPARDISTRTTGRIFSEATSRYRMAESVVDFTVMPYFPIVIGKKGVFWGAVSESHWRVFLALVPAVLLLYWIALRRHRHLLVLQGSTLLMGAVFSDLFYRGGTRHFGITFVAFVACLWLLRSRGERVPWAAHPLLGLTVIGGVIASVGSWHRPFSNAEATANWLTSQHLDALPLLGSPDTSVVGVAEVLHRPIYMLDCRCTDTFVLFSTRRDQFSAKEIPQRISEARASVPGKDFIYLTSAAFTAQQQTQIAGYGFSISPLAQFTGAEAGHEDFYVYRLGAPDAR